MKTRVCLIYLVHNCLWKQFFACNLPQSLSNFLDNFGNYGAFHTVSLKLEQQSYEKVLNFALLDNYFTDLFTEVQIRYRKTFKFGPGCFFFSPKVKRSVIISKKHDISELPHELQNDLTFRILGN